MTGWSLALFESLPGFIQEQLLLPRQSNGHLNVEQVETEKLLSTLVEQELQRRAKLRKFSGKYSFVTQSIDYNARSSSPSNFDCNLAYSHGVAAAALLASGVHGYLTCIQGLGLPPSSWTAGAVPLMAIMKQDQLVVSSDKKDSVKVCPTLVSMHTPEIMILKSKVDHWKLTDAYCNPGPLQFDDDTPLQKIVHRVLSIFNVG